jgi:hypothetical protein
MYKLSWYLLDDLNNPYPTDDMYAAEALLSDADKRRIDLTEMDIGGHKISISTVFLVMDHSYGHVPTLYETMVFIDDNNAGISKFTKRYSTREEAILGHQEIVDSVKQLPLDLLIA